MILYYYTSWYVIWYSITHIICRHFKIYYYSPTLQSRFERSSGHLHHLAEEMARLLCLVSTMVSMTQKVWYGFLSAKNKHNTPYLTHQKAISRNKLHLKQNTTSVITLIMTQTWRPWFSRHHHYPAAGHSGTGLGGWLMNVGLEDCGYPL